MKQKVLIQIQINDHQKRVIKNYTEAKRKRFGLKDDGHKFNQPDAIREIIDLSESLVNDKIKQWGSEMVDQKLQDLKKEMDNLKQ